MVLYLYPSLINLNLGRIRDKVELDELLIFKIKKK